MILTVSQRRSVPQTLAFIAAAALGTILLAFAARFCLEHRLSWICPLIALFNIPCPSCGSTRAFAALASFELVAAVKFNPLLVLGILALPFLGWAKFMPLTVRKYGWWIFGAAVTLNWIYLFLFLPR